MVWCYPDHAANTKGEAMNIKSKALMIGAGVAAALQILSSICSQIVTYFTFNPALYDPAAIEAADPTALLGSLGTAGLVGVLVCCVALLSDVVGGYLYSHFHANEDPMLQLQDGVIGGAITGMAARLISGLFGVCIGLVFTQFLMADLYAQVPEAAAGGLIGGAVGGIGGICLGLVFGLFLGAIGGAIGASVRGRK